MKLIVLAAGKGTRFLPITKEIPKGLIPLDGHPLLEWVIAPFIPSITEIIFVINNELGHKIEENFGCMYKNLPVRYVFQGDESKGTFYALQSIKDLILEDELFCVCNSDDLFNEREINVVIKQNVPGIGVSSSVMPWSYLGIDVEQGFVKGFRRHEKSEKVVRDKFSNGFHILSKEILDFEPVLTNDKEAGLPHTLFASLEKYPLKAFEFDNWKAVNGPEDISDALMFIQKNY